MKIHTKLHNGNNYSNLSWYNPIMIGSYFVAALDPSHFKSCYKIISRECFHSAMKHKNDVSNTVGSVSKL